MRQLGGIALWIFGTALLAWGLLFLAPYGSLLLWSACQQSVLALSYSFLGGMGGEVHLGHGVFFGLGAYASAICFQAGCPWWGCVLAAGTSGVMLSMGLARFLVRLRGMEFAVCSLCLALLASILGKNLEGLTGGVAGISLPTTPMEIPYVCSVLLLAGTVRIHSRLIASSWGRALRAVGMDPLAASHLGVHAQSLRSQALVAGSGLASLAGGIYPLQSCYLSPDSAFGMEVLLGPVVAVLLGGSKSTWGPLLGAAGMVLVQEIILTRFQGGTLLALGLFMMASGLIVSGELKVWSSLKRFVPFKHSRADAS